MQFGPAAAAACFSIIMASHSSCAPDRVGGFQRTAFWKIDREASDEQVRARAEALAGSAIDTVILGGGGHHYLHNDLPDIDRYIAAARRITDACHRHGIKVVEHHSVVLTGDKAYAEAHAEWLQCDFETGRPSIWPEYQTYAFCPNNIEFREHYWKIARRIMVEGGFDGLMADDTVFHHGCCCAVCSARWQNEVGGDIREAYRLSRKPGTAEWRQFNEVRRRWYADFRAWLRDRQSRELPGTSCVALIGSPLTAWGTQTHGGGVEEGLDTADAAIWEVYNPADFYSWRRLSAEASALCEAAGTRGCVPVCLPYADTVQKPDEYDPQEEVFMWGLARAHGMPFGLGRVFLNGPTEADPERGCLLFERERLKPYLDSEPLASIGIMFSRNSRNSDPAWESMHSAPAIAWAESLLDECIPWRAVTEQTLDVGLPKGLRTLIMPNVFALSENHLAAIERFVRGGGTLVATYLPAVCDETGEPALERRAKRLAKLLGVRIRSADMVQSGPEPPRADFETACAARSARDIEVYENGFGRGKVFYLPSLVERKAFIDWVNEGKRYYDRRDRAVTQAMAQLVDELTPCQPVRVTRQAGAGHILTTVRRAGRRTLVFILNSAGADLSNGRIVPSPSRVVWAAPTQITLTFPRMPKSVRLISLDKEEDRFLPRSSSVSIMSPKRFGLVVAAF